MAVRAESKNRDLGGGDEFLMPQLAEPQCDAGRQVRAWHDENSRGCFKASMEPQETTSTRA